MSIPDDSEEKPLTFSELQALAEKLDLDGLASEVRGRTREEVPDVSEEDLLALDGKKARQRHHIRRPRRNPACLQPLKGEG